MLKEIVNRHVMKHRVTNRVFAWDVLTAIRYVPFINGTVLNVPYKHYWFGFRTCSWCFDKRERLYKIIERYKVCINVDRTCM